MQEGTVLQISLLPGRIQIQGVWRISVGNQRLHLAIKQAPADVSSLSAQFDICPIGQRCGAINPIFRYPSEAHLGELRSEWSQYCIYTLRPMLPHGPWNGHLARPAALSSGPWRLAGTARGWGIASDDRVAVMRRKWTVPASAKIWPRLEHGRQRCGRAARKNSGSVQRRR
jgi:hypothetical protein